MSFLSAASLRQYLIADRRKIDRITLNKMVCEYVPHVSLHVLHILGQIETVAEIEGGGRNPLNPTYRCPRPTSRKCYLYDPFFGAVHLSRFTKAKLVPPSWKDFSQMLRYDRTSKFAQIKQD